MASDGGDNRIPSNEEIVDELTKDLKRSAIKSDSDGDVSSTRLGQCDSGTDDDDDDGTDKVTETKDEDHIDDRLLKERDEQLTDDEKRVSIFRHRLCRTFLLFPVLGSINNAFRTYSVRRDGEFNMKTLAVLPVLCY